MLTIGIDPHKDTHCAVAVNAVGRQLATPTEPARREGIEKLSSAQLAGPELEVRLLVVHRERLVRQRTGPERIPHDQDHIEGLVGRD